MLIALPCRRRVDAAEYIDEPDIPIEDIRDTLRDQAFVNRWLGGANAALAHVLPLLRTRPSEPVRILDLACGGGDLSRRIVDGARKMPRSLEVVALDLNENTVESARQASGGYPEINFQHGDALRPPFDHGTFDIVILATFLHHLSPDDVITVLKTAKDLSKEGVVASDLVRSPVAYLGIRALARLMRFSPISAHDGAVSVCRAYTPNELAHLARCAGMASGTIFRHSFYRMTLVYLHSREISPGDR